jgi:hypothetical protein
MPEPIMVDRHKDHVCMEVDYQPAANTPSRPLLGLPGMLIRALAVP